MNLETPKQLASQITHVYVDSECFEDTVAKRVLKHFPANKVSDFRDHEENMASGEMSPEEFAKSKTVLRLTRYKGTFFKRCPGATQKRALTCCNYFVLNLGQQCNMNCSYCYLQSYLNTPMMTIYTNGDSAIGELEQTADRFPESAFRVGTGEVIDSLSLDPLTLYSNDLINFCNRHPKWSVEFKTKSDHIDQFLDSPHSGNVIVSWSVNPEYVVNREEHGTASLCKRLTAAERCVAKGFPVSFHIDPIIHHQGWQDHYAELVDQITERFEPSQVRNISLGTLRFQPQQRHMMRRRFGAQSLVVQSEMFTSQSGKMRYDASIRADMSKFVIDRFREKPGQWNTYICMETPENWIASYGSLPNKENLGELFKPAPRI